MEKTVAVFPARGHGDEAVVMAAGGQPSYKPPPAAQSPLEAPGYRDSPGSPYRPTHQSPTEPLSDTEKYGWSVGVIGHIQTGIRLTG